MNPTIKKIYHTKSGHSWKYPFQAIFDATREFFPVPTCYNTITRDRARIWMAFYDWQRNHPEYADCRIAIILVDRTFLVRACTHQESIEQTRINMREGMARSNKAWLKFKKECGEGITQEELMTRYKGIYWTRLYRNLRCWKRRGWIKEVNGLITVV